MILYSQIILGSVIVLACIIGFISRKYSHSHVGSAVPQWLLIIAMVLTLISLSLFHDDLHGSFDRDVLVAGALVVLLGVVAGMLRNRRKTKRQSGQQRGEDAQ